MDKIKALFASLGSRGLSALAASAGGVAALLYPPIVGWCLIGLGVTYWIRWFKDVSAKQDVQ